MENGPKELVAEAVERLGKPLATRTNRTFLRSKGRFPGRPSTSTRDGYRPAAKTHVERFLSHKLLGLSIADLAARDDIQRQSVKKSIRIGRELAERNAKPFETNVR